MVRCHLARLMGEHKMKIVDVARETGLNRNTVTLLYKETAQRIELDALDKLEGFASQHGPDFYGLPRNEGTITLVREEWTLPEEIILPDGRPIVPFFAGQSVSWKLQN